MHSHRFHACFLYFSIFSLVRFSTTHHSILQDRKRERENFSSLKQKKLSIYSQQSYLARTKFTKAPNCCEKRVFYSITRTNSENLVPTITVLCIFHRSYLEIKQSSTLKNEPTGGQESEAKIGPRHQSARSYRLARSMYPSEGRVHRRHQPTDHP